MLNEAVKKAMFTSEEYFRAKKWEGKPFKVKFKYLFANYPEMLLMGVVLTTICPAVLWYRHYTFENSRRDVITKFKRNYKVVREDDPNIERIIAEKKLGKEYFPE